MPRKKPPSTKVEWSKLFNKEILNMEKLEFFTADELEELVVLGRISRDIKMAGGLLDIKLIFPTDKERAEANIKNLKEIKSRTKEEKEKILDLDEELKNMFNDEFIIIKSKDSELKLSEMNSTVADAILSKRTQLNSSIWGFMMSETATETEKK